MTIIIIIFIIIILIIIVIVIVIISIIIIVIRQKNCFGMMVIGSLKLPRILKVYFEKDYAMRSARSVKKILK